jgi:predicted TIM-barrel fold metal-dependent hydrolase
MVSALVLFLGEHSWIECNFVFSNFAVVGLRLVLHSLGEESWEEMSFSANSERVATGRGNFTMKLDPPNLLGVSERVSKMMME